MLPLLALRTAYNADDDNIWLPIPTKLGLLRLGVDWNSAEEEDDDNWYIGISYHSPWGKFSIGYHSNDAEDDDNWYVGISYHSPWGKFSIGYHSNDEEDDENLRLWADLATAIGRFGFEYHNSAEEEKKVATKKPFRINKEMLKRWYQKYGRRVMQKLRSKRLALPKLAHKKVIAPKKNFDVPSFIKKHPYYFFYQLYKATR